MTRKHACPSCSTSSTFDSDWLNNLPYVVIARHIHTGKIGDSAQFATLKEAESYVHDMKERCTSHENFVVLERRIQ